MASVWFRSNSPLNKGQIHIGRESWVFTKRGEARIKPAKTGRGWELFERKQEKVVKYEEKNTIVTRESQSEKKVRIWVCHPLSIMSYFLVKVRRGGKS